MPVGIVIHLVASSTGIITGFVALFSRKGEVVHRRSGIFFVVAMFTMASTGVAMATLKGQAASVIGGTLTAYLVVSALIAVRPVTVTSRRIEWVGLFVSGLLGIASVTLGATSLARGAFMRNGIPVPIYLIFGSVALLASLGDVRLMRAGLLRGNSRIARHLWRMCFALWIAAASFFWGPPRRVAMLLPAALIKPALLAIPVLIPLIALLYWMWKVKLRKTFRYVAKPAEAA